MLKLFLFTGASLVTGICHAQYVNKDYLHGEWEFGAGPSHTIINFINDSTEIVSAPKQPTIVVPYVLDSSQDGFTIILEKPKDGDSIVSIYSRIIKINNNEMKTQTIRIRHFDRATKKWGDYSMPAEAGMLYKRKKK